MGGGASSSNNISYSSKRRKINKNLKFKRDKTSLRLHIIKGLNGYLELFVYKV